MLATVRLIVWELINNPLLLGNIHMFSQSMPPLSWCRDSFGVKMTMKHICLSLFLIFIASSAFAFDHSHAAWDALLKQHVHWNADGVASRVDYAALQKNPAGFNGYLQKLSAVSESEYARWSKPQQLSFLINAYNAFTIELILTRYPDLTSIKDLGSFFSSPWKKEFFILLGKERSLDDLEQGMIRQPGVFNEPRIHVALVCASIGCPGLRNEAFIAERLDEQLEDSLHRFLSDRSRNRYNPETDKLEVSKIFDWYGEDFVGFRGHPSVASFLGDYAELLAADPNDRLRLKAGDIPLEFLDYDWRLNDLRR